MQEKNKLLGSVSKICAVDLMPDDKYSCDILRERAKKLAKFTAENDSIENNINYIRIRLNDNEYFGISYRYAKEVIDNITLTLLPNVHEFIAGVINYRGALLTIIDLKNFFHIKKSENQKNFYVVVVESQEMSIGILADNIDGSDEYDKEALNSVMPYDGVVDTRFISGLHHGITAILNIEAIVIELQTVLGNH